MVNIKIEGVSYQVKEGLTILEAAKACGYEIPSLCTFNHGECSGGSCRVCLVEVKGARGLVASCVYPVGEGMEITISSPKAPRTEGGKPIYSMSRLQSFCQCYDISIGIITVPAEHAQEACDRLIDCDVEAIWNFSPAHLNVPEHVVVQSENLAVSLTALRMQLKNREK